jgi:tetratricopeptide (TPR) repeat protein
VARISEYPRDTRSYCCIRKSGGRVEANRKEQIRKWGVPVGGFPHGRNGVFQALTVAALLLGMASCARTPLEPKKDGVASRAEPISLGSHTYHVSTASPQAQKAFDRGLTLAYGFAHQAAEREFRKAAEQDPQCAMAWWGVALVNGPHINFPLVPPDRAKTAWEALSKARSLAAGASPTERGLIDALGRRYAEHQPEDRRPLDEAYSGAMRELWRSNQSDADIGTLFAESMMDLRPWNLWTADGKPQPGTDEIVSTLERVLQIDPNHPGANHLFIHAIEGSPHPERSVKEADRLRDLVPGASHLVHMPAHIYARVGRWDDALGANARAIEADAAYRQANPNPGFYAMYMAHNQHFYAYAAMMTGQSAATLKAARAMTAAVPEEFLRDYGPAADGFMVFVPEALMRFGRWEEVLAEPPPRGSLPLSTALWRFTRAASLTALGRAKEASAEREAFRRAAGAVPKGWTFGNNSAADILSIASKVLDGEMAAKRDKFEESAKLLREAVAVEDRLRYDEPPDWMQPVRHTLGAVLLRAGKYAEAEKVYREDLVRYPENGWSLFGLGRALRLQKKDAEAGSVEERFARIWSRADVRLGSTCYCQPGI